MFVSVLSETKLKEVLLLNILREYWRTYNVAIPAEIDESEYGCIVTEVIFKM